LLLVARSTTLVFITWSSSIQIFREISVGTGHQQNSLGTERRRRRPPPALPRRPRPRCPRHAPSRGPAPQRAPARGALASAPPYARRSTARHLRRHPLVTHGRAEQHIKHPLVPRAPAPSRPPPLPPPPGAGAHRPCSPPTSCPVSFPSSQSSSRVRLLPSISPPRRFSPSRRGHRRRPPLNPVAGHLSASTPATYSS
jgi:hypothetical protein